MCLTVAARPGLPASTGFPLDPSDPNVDCRRIRMLLIGVNEKGQRPPRRCAESCASHGEQRQGRVPWGGQGLGHTEGSRRGRQGREKAQGGNESGEASGVGLEGRRDFPP